MIIYSKFNSNRKACYKLITRIETEGNIRIATKESYDNESIIFLNTIYDKYNYLKNNHFSFEPIEPKKYKNTKISFEYQETPTLKTLLIKSFKEKDRSVYISIIKEYLIKIKQNEIKNELPSNDFISIFGDSEKHKMECLKVSCIDLNFDNIFYNIKSKKYNLIDYEWTFLNFSVPYKYIFFRAITNLYSDQFEYKLTEFCPLKDIFKIANISDKEEQLFINFEYNFQCHIYDNNFKKNITFSEHLSNYTQLKTPHTFNETPLFLKERDKLQSELNQIRSSKFYKLWQKFNDFKKIIKRT